MSPSDGVRGSCSRPTSGAPSERRLLRLGLEKGEPLYIATRLCLGHYVSSCFVLHWPRDALSLTRLRSSQLLGRLTGSEREGVPCCYFLLFLKLFFCDKGVHAIFEACRLVDASSHIRLRSNPTTNNGLAHYVPGRPP